jgi:hypothetical protein
VEIQWVEKGRNGAMAQVEPLMRKKGQTLSLTRPAYEALGSPQFVAVGVAQNGFGHYIVIRAADGRGPADRAFKSRHVNGRTIAELPMKDGSYPVRFENGMAVAYAEA